MIKSCRGIAALIIALVGASTLAQTEYESRTSPSVYEETGQYVDSYSDDSSYSEEEDSYSAPRHGGWAECCERRDYEDQPTSIPRTGPEYEFQNMGEPWDSYARLRRAQNETNDAQDEVDRTTKAHNQSSWELDIAEMTGGGYDPYDEWYNPNQEEENEYEHTAYEQTQAWRRYDDATTEEDSARRASDSADADYDRWLEGQSKPDSSRREVTEIFDDTSSSEYVSKEVLLQVFENVARDDFYETLGKHADGKATIEQVEDAYKILQGARR